MKFGAYGQSRFLWNAIVSSWHSNELKTARLSIPYCHSPFTLPPPPVPSSSRDARSCFSFVLIQPASQNLSFPIPLSLQGSEKDLGTTLPEESKEILVVRSLGNRQPQS